jgi:hypothetical protein
MNIRYEGSRRVNNPIGIAEWNVFPTWKDECPRAAELAEVCSLRSPMWLLLDQIALDNADGSEDYSSEVVHWDGLVGRYSTVLEGDNCSLREAGSERGNSNEATVPFVQGAIE